jgi:tetratricopeptide (TPR) repeat protein
MLLTSGIDGAIRPSLDRQALLTRIPRIVGKKLRSAASAGAVDVRSDDGARAAQARAALDALQDAIRDAASMPGGRKTLVWMSEGIDPPTDVHAQVRDAAALANRGDVSVYALDPRGVAGRLGDNIDARGREFTADVLLAEERASQAILEDMAASTDGLAFVKTSNFAGVFDRIKADTSIYYLLSYRRSPSAAKGYHRIEVQVNRPGVTVRARTGYDDRLPFSPPAPSAPPPPSPAPTAPPTREPTPSVAAPERPPVAFSGQGQFPSQPVTYIILIDTESFDEEEARKACAVAGAFVDGLDPDDRVVILSVASGVGPVEASRDRLAAGGALASIVETAAARPRERGLTLFRAFEIASGDPAVVNSMAAARASVYDRDAFEGAKRDIQNTAAQVLKQYAAFLSEDPLAPATTRLLSEQDASRPTAVVWFSNRPRLLTGGDNGTDRRLIDAAVAAHARVSVVTTLSADLAVRLRGSGSHTLMEGYAAIVSGTGGVLVRGASSVDAAAGRLLEATEALGRRRPDPAGRSELTSLRRAAERPLKSPYAALVRQYLMGDADAAVRALLSWDAEQATASVHPLSSRAELDAAIALHTEAGCRSSSAPAFEYHFWITQRAMAATVSRMRDAPLRRYWIRAIATGSAVHARQIAPDDPEIESAVLVALGALMESPSDALREAQTDFDHPRVPEADLARAAVTYREALALNADLWEARLRLGSVLGRLHQTDEAMAQLERVRTQANDSRFRYLAWLCLGQIHEEAGRTEAARAAYDEAVRAFPDGFIARTALAHLLESSGRVAEGRKVLQEALLRPPSGRAESDPWHEYLYSSLSLMEQHLAALREVARRQSEVPK